MSIVYYPLPAIGVSRGPPRYAMYEPNMSEEYFDEEPEEYMIEDDFYIDDPEIMELSNAMASGEFQEGDLDENGIINEHDVLRGPSGGWGGGVGNVIGAGLPAYFRNSLMPLDSWQSHDKLTDELQEIAALEEELANTNLQSKLDLENALEEGKTKITKWHIMIISGTITSLIATVMLIYRRVGKK